jgi:hypothetical protein
VIVVWKGGGTVPDGVQKQKQDYASRIRYKAFDGWKVQSYSVLQLHGSAQDSDFLRKLHEAAKGWVQQ